MGSERDQSWTPTGGAGRTGWPLLSAPSPISPAAWRRRRTQLGDSGPSQTLVWWSPTHTRVSHPEPWSSGASPRTLSPDPGLGELTRSILALATMLITGLTDHSQNPLILLVWIHLTQQLFSALQIKKNNCSAFVHEMGGALVNQPMKTAGNLQPFPAGYSTNTHLTATFCSFSSS